MDASDLIDAMLRNDPYGSPDQTAAPTQPGQTVASPPTPADATTGPPPSVLDLLSRTQTAPPAIPAANPQDTSNILPLTLLRFAASVTRPRMGAESPLSAILGSGYDAAGYASELNAAAQQKAIQQRKDAGAIALQDAQLQEARLGAIGKAQDITTAQAKAPLELEQLKNSIANAKSETELHNIQIRVAAIQAKYQDQLSQAELAERQAKTTADKAQAAMEQAHAKYFLELSNDLLETARMKSNAKPSYAFKESIPGEPDKVVDQRTGQIYLAPMSPANAWTYAQQQAKAMRDAGDLKSDSDMKSKAREIYQQALKGTIPAQPTAAAGGTTPGASPAAAAPGASSGAAPSLLDQVTAASAKDASGVYRLSAANAPDKQDHYFIGGKEVSASEANARMKKPAGGPPAVMTQTGAAAPAASADAAMLEQFSREDSMIQRGIIRDYSAPVKAWLNARQANSGADFAAGNAAAMAEMRATEQARARRIAGGGNF